MDTNDNFSPVCFQRLQLLTESYLENGEEPFTVDILKEMTSKDLTMNILLFLCTDMALVLVCHRVLSLDVYGVDVPPCTGSKNWYWQMV